MRKNVTESDDKVRKNVTRPKFFRHREGSLNAHFTQVCLFLTALPASLLPVVQTTMPANRQRQARRWRCYRSDEYR